MENSLKMVFAGGEEKLFTEEKVALPIISDIWERVINTSDASVRVLNPPHE